VSCVVQTHAAKDGDFVRCQGSQELLDGDNLVGHHGVTRDRVDIIALDDISFQLSRLSGGSEIKVRGGQNRLATESPAVCGLEADESVPSHVHGEINLRIRGKF